MLFGFVALLRGFAFSMNSFSMTLRVLAFMFAERVSLMVVLSQSESATYARTYTVSVHQF